MEKLPQVLSGLYVYIISCMFSCDFTNFFSSAFIFFRKEGKKVSLLVFYTFRVERDAYLSVYKSLCFYGNIKRTFKRCLIALFRMDFYWFVSRFIRIDVKWNGELRRFLLPSGLLKIYRLMSCAGHFNWFNKRSLGSKLIHLASFPLHSSRSTLKSKKFS